MQLRLPSTALVIAGLLVTNVCLAGQLAAPDGTREPTKGLLYCPANPDNPTFRAEVSAALGGLAVDYFDARTATPTVEQMQEYRAVFTWENYSYDERELMGNRLAEYVDLGGRVIMGQWATPTGGSTEGGIWGWDYFPATSTSYSSGSYMGDGTDCVHQGIAEYYSQYLDVAYVREGFMSDGTMSTGTLAVAWRPDRRVYYSPGNTGATVGTGEWAQLTANMVLCSDEPIYVACCDPYTGDCVDNVASVDCVPPLQILWQTSCTELDPPCGIPGCCCIDDTAGVTVEYQVNCDGRFLPGVLGEECATDAFDPPCGEYFPCEHTIAMWDDWGDGWNNGYIDVYVAGELVMPGVTLASGSGPGYAYFEAATGDEITTVWTPGGWPYEASYCIYAVTGAELGCDGMGGVDPTGITVTAYCGEPGACCDPYTGECVDDVVWQECLPPLQHFGIEQCGELDPPCGNPGCCCMEVWWWCDLNNDGVVDTADLNMLYLAFGSQVGDPGWLPAADYDGDGRITLVDWQAWRQCYTGYDEGAGAVYVELEANCGGRFLGGVLDGECSIDAFYPPCGEWEPVGTLYCPSQQDNAAFRAEVSAITGSPCDYYDARLGTPSLELLRQYECVLTWCNYPYADRFAMGDRLADYVDAGGHVILGQWTLHTTHNSWLEGRIMTADYLPVTATSYVTAGTTYTGDGVGCEFAGIAALQATYCDLISLRPGPFWGVGTWATGTLVAGWRLDKGVTYAAGHTGMNFSTGDWAQFTVNLCSCSGGPAYGACCDIYTGECEDEIELMDCLPPLQFHYQKLCDELVPPCGVPGCCCERPETGEVQEPVWSLEANCDGRFLSGVLGEDCVAEAFTPDCGLWEPVGLLYAPSHPDNAAFRAEIEALTGSACDYYDARTGTPSLAMLQEYECVMTWVNYAYADNVAMGDVLADYADAGGRVILGQWCLHTTQGNWLDGRIMAAEYLPITGTSYITGGTFYMGDGIGYEYQYVDTLYATYCDQVSLAAGPFWGSGTWSTGTLVAAWRVDKAVTYSAGNTGGTYGSGDWAQFTVNLSSVLAFNPPGACCDVYTGECADYVPLFDCRPPLEFHWMYWECADLDPPCGNPGCCCVDTEYEFSVEYQANCAGRFLPGVLGDDCDIDAFDPPCGEWECAGLLYAPSESDSAAFRNWLAALLGQPVDYFDARVATPTLEQIKEYCYVMTWVNYPYADNVAMGDVLADFADIKPYRRVILGQWCLPTADNYLAGRIMTAEYCPGTASSYASGNYMGDGHNCVHLLGTVSYYGSSYVDIVTPTTGVFWDGTFSHGGKAVVWRRDSRVYYSAGNTGMTYSTGDWVQLTYNICTCYSPSLGSCCNVETGECQDHVVIFDCAPYPLGWHFARCDQLIPPCGNPGCCCDDEFGTVSVEFRANCAGRFLPGVVGDDCTADAFNPPCGNSGCCCDDEFGTVSVEFRANCAGRFLPGVLGDDCVAEAFTPECGLYQACEHSITMWDDYGDGWNDGYIDVYVGGILALSGLTLASGSGPGYAHFQAEHGEEITTVWTPGGWPYEASYCIYGYDGGEIGCDGLGGVDPTGITVYGSCQEPECGDGICHPSENCVTCPEDCGECECISQLPNQSNGIFSDIDCDFCTSGVQILAEQFVIMEETTVVGVNCWGGYYPDNIPTAADAFTLIFRNDSGGLPGAEIAKFGPLAGARSQTGIVLFGVDEYLHELPVELTLGAGTYWIELFNDTSGSTESWFWEAGIRDPAYGIAGQAFTFDAYPLESWSFDGSTDMAYELICE